MDTKITPTHNWDLTNCWIKLDDPDTRTWAEFIINNLTAKNKEYIQGTLTIMVKNFGWLDSSVAMLMGVVVESQMKPIIKAIDSEKITSTKYPSAKYQRERHMIGAAICELIAQGYGNEFLNGVGK
ncbi:conserved hypothetical protein [Vibrio chagasii]|nr:conserved hypothetical protein [Vibrio chagasii]